eukprot:scaffold69669_cov65-Phaeocystis_antarctica.AAC.3
MECLGRTRATHEKLFAGNAWSARALYCMERTGMAWSASHLEGAAAAVRAQVTLALALPLPPTLVTLKALLLRCAP